MTKIYFWCSSYTGGPGGGIGETDRQYFDPEAYKIVRSARSCVGAFLFTDVLPD